MTNNTNTSTLTGKEWRKKEVNDGFFSQAPIRAYIAAAEYTQNTKKETIGKKLLNQILHRNSQSLIAKEFQQSQCE